MFEIIGVGGNLAAVAASKLSTYYHKNAEPGILPSNWSMSRFLSFRRAFFSADFDSRAVSFLFNHSTVNHSFLSCCSLLHNQHCLKFRHEYFCSLLYRVILFLIG